MLLNLLHIFLAFAVFFSSTGLLINKHLCGGKIKDVAFFVDAEACKHAKKIGTNKFVCRSTFKTELCCQQTSPNKQENPKYEKDNCCKNESEYHKASLQSDLDQDLTVEDYTPPVNLYFAPSILPLGYSFPIPSSDLQKSKYYRPPPLCRRIFVLLESFLC